MKRYLLHFTLPILGLAGLCLLNSFFFNKIFGGGWRGYLDWYLSAGPLIGLALVAFAISWQALDKNEGLVSAHPLKYFAACAWMVGLPVTAFGGHCKADNQHKANPWDVLISKILIAVFTVAAIAWLLLIAPVQYFLFLICGAPSRVALNSNYRLRAVLETNELKLIEPKPDEPEPTDGWDASMRDKPVTMANAFGVAVLFLAGYLLST